MRVYKQNTLRTISVFAIAGSHTVLLGMNATEEGRKGLLGFSIERWERALRGKRKWHNPKRLTGFLTFRETEPVNYLEEDYLKEKDHIEKGRAKDIVWKDKDRYWHHDMARPIQDFKWGDYVVSPGRKYLYKIFPKYGTPGEDLRAGPPVVVEVETEPLHDPRTVHDIYFNRGVVASQAFERLFPAIAKQMHEPTNRRKSAKKMLEEELEKPGPVRRWLSRYLEEAILGFIAQAKGEAWGLRCCFYEFSYAPVLEAIRAASKNGADVKILFDDTPSSSSPSKNNRKAIKAAGIGAICSGRNTGSAISHNKFMILLRKGEPIAVWTGSTNITQGGILGHSNVGHAVRDPLVARHYRDYWENLSTQPKSWNSAKKKKALRAWNRGLRPWNDEHLAVNPGGEPPHGTRLVFSPRGYNQTRPCPYEAMNYYASLLNGAQSGVFLTAAFGISEEFTEMLNRERSFLRYVLLDNPGQARKKGSKNKGSIERTAEILSNDKNRVAIGSYVPENALEDWHEEHKSPINGHVRYVHTKYMLIDPLSDYPTVITGSANFSRNSTYNNDENMLIIEGNTRVADIYLTEFMRLWSQFYFRDYLTGALDAAKKARSIKDFEVQRRYEGKKPRKRYLDSSDAWTEKFYEEGSVRAIERQYFNGQGRKHLAKRAVSDPRNRPA